jgi:hypothetical protein
VCFLVFIVNLLNSKKRYHHGTVSESAAAALGVAGKNGARKYRIVTVFLSAGNSGSSRRAATRPRCSLLLPQVHPLAVPFHLDFRYGMDLPYRCPLSSNHRNVLVVIEQPPTDSHRHILIHHSIQVRLRPLVDWPGSSCGFNDDSLADVVDARSVTRV